MTQKTNEKIASLLDCISKDIDKQEKLADNAMEALERMAPTSSQDFFWTNVQLAVRTYVARYLRHIRSIVAERDIKKAENVIRFHIYQQEQYGTYNRHGFAGATLLTAILKRYMSVYFQKALASQTNN